MKVFFLCVLAAVIFLIITDFLFYKITGSQIEKLDNFIGIIQGTILVYAYRWIQIKFGS